MLDLITRAFEAIGSSILVLGLLLAVGVALRVLLVQRDGHAAYKIFRATFGGAILMGLEVMVAADLVQTVAVEPTLQSVLTLALIVLIRTFLSFSLEIEIEGVPPWRKALVSGARVTTDAVRRGLADGPVTSPVD